MEPLSAAEVRCSSLWCVVFRFGQLDISTRKTMRNAHFLLKGEGHKRILVEPENSLIRQYVALLKTENVELVFGDDAITAIADLSAEINTSVENIGARRLHTVLERLLEEVSFTATDSYGRCGNGPGTRWQIGQRHRLE